MNWEPDPQLEAQFLRLLEEADPETSNQVDVAQGFAKGLASFAEVWATNEEAVDEYEQQLSNWIESLNSRRLMKAGEALTAYEQRVERARAED